MARGVNGPGPARGQRHCRLPRRRPRRRAADFDASGRRKEARTEGRARCGAPLRASSEAHPGSRWQARPTATLTAATKTACCLTVSAPPSAGVRGGLRARQLGARMRSSGGRRRGMTRSAGPEARPRFPTGPTEQKSRPLRRPGVKSSSRACARENRRFRCLGDSSLFRRHSEPAAGRSAPGLAGSLGRSGRGAAKNARGSLVREYGTMI